MEQPFFEDVKVPPVDVVVGLHVFEHMLSPSQFLAKTREALGDDGLLYLEVPNLSRGGNLNHFFQLPHLYTFSQTTLANMLRVNGFRPTHWWERKKFMRVLAVPFEPIPLSNIELYDIDAFIECRAEDMERLRTPAPTPRSLIKRARRRVGQAVRKGFRS